MSSCGSKSFTLFKNLVAPDSPKDKTFTQLVDVMKAHVTPTPSVIMECFNFFKRDRDSTESIGTYVSELRKLSRNCEFGNSLNDMLRDRLVVGSVMTKSNVGFYRKLP